MPAVACSSPRLARLGLTCVIVATIIAVGTASFTTTGQMATARDGASAALLDDGRVLVTGNRDLGLASEVYDPGTATFSATADLTESRYAGVSVRLDDGRVLVVGGWDGTSALASAELYDPSAGLFSASANSMSTGRVAPSITRLVDGRILIAGGHDGVVPIGSAEVYDPNADSFGTDRKHEHAAHRAGHAPADRACAHRRWRDG